MTLSLSTLYGFLLVLTRVAGAFVFLPVPGMKDGPQPARILFALALTIALAPSWPAIDASATGAGAMAGFAISEAAFGITIGLAVAFLTETLLLAAEAIGMQAGFAYASMIDPATQADSTVLLVFSQLAAGLLFFALGLDRHVLRIFARSLEISPPGSFHISAGLAESVVRLGGQMFSVGLRLALPVMALVLLVDVSLVLLGRLNAQLQLLSMTFPVKMTAALVLLAWMAAVFPRVYAGFAARIWSTLEGALLYGR